MSYYFSKTIQAYFAEAIDQVTAALAEEGFGILTQIDVQATLKKKLDVDFKPYVILGACNPPYAYKALQAEEKVGTMLPCNVVVMEQAPGEVEIAAVDPLASMQSIQNPGLAGIAGEIRDKLQSIIQGL
ncbi:MAG: DUF302 domain-containing protein [Fidelibacterota bacterium]